MIDPLTPATARTFSFQTSDLDEARSICRSFYYPIAMDLLRPTSRLAFSFKVIQLGPITVGDLHFGSDARLSSGDLVTAYHVNVPIRGHLESEHRGREVLAHAERAAVYQPVGETVLRRWSAVCRLLCVKIDREALEAQLEAALDRPVRGPLDLASSLDLSQGAGRSWLHLIRLLASDMENGGGLAFQPMVGEQLCDSVTAGLLLAVDHRYRDELLRPGPATRPRTVKRAVDAMEADPAHPFTVTELARAAEVSVRALQNGFHRHVGVSPMAYLRQLRLARVHDELRRADPSRVTVADVAHRWGFTHLGRFAGAYRAKYGAAPSVTMRSTR